MTTYLKSKAFLASTMTLPFLLMGCPGEEPSSSDPMKDMTQTDLDMPADLEDGVQEDMKADMTDMPADRVDMEDMCVPLAECPADTCGELSDGCGGTIQCEPCACEGGIPSSTYCGPCGLGRSYCETTENGPSLCSLDEEFILTESMCQEMLYVSSGVTPGMGDGTRDNPMGSLQAAIDALAPTGGLVVLQAGEYTLEERVKLANGVHILGGVTSEWLFDPLFKSKLTISPSGEYSHMIGVEAQNIEDSTFLKNLEIVTLDVEAGKNLYSMHVRTSPGLHLEDVSIRSGSIADSPSGERGADGADGLPGGDAEVRVTLTKRVGDMTAHGYENGAFAGEAGINQSCHQQASGGQGGEGFHVLAEDPPGDPVQITYTVIPGESGGSNMAGEAGGQAGSSRDHEGHNGRQGDQGRDGMHGMRGVSQGTVIEGFWSVNASGSRGGDGEHGTGGSGGGGSFWMEEAMNPAESKPGASGGGGGAGGCGGQGGNGGLGGGSGFGLMLVDSTGITLERVTIQGPDAGNGGNGGRGGRAGLGALGGQGSQVYAVTATSTTTVPHSQRGGTGGRGEDGGAGGFGGGGAGGSSFGMYCSNTTVVRIDSVQANAGEPGEGGFDGGQADGGYSQHAFACW